jgi:hypothetical protein
VSVSPRLTLSRRALVGAAAAIACISVTGSARAQGVNWTPATTAHKIKLYLESGGSGKAIGSIPGKSSVRVLAGPDPSGWYLVDAGENASSTPGWTAGENLLFSSRAKILWDAGLYAAPTDATGWVGWVRHNLIVTIAGPSTNGFTFVRCGNQAGYTYDSTLQATDAALPETTGEWWVDANRSTLKVNLMVGTTSVDQFPCTMSTETGDGFYSTAIGEYWIYEKVEGLQYTPYAHAYFMYWAGFDPYRFNGFHSWTMDGNGYVLNGGWGNTAGCIATKPADAAVIYNFVQIGTRTEIHW